MFAKQHVNLKSERKFKESVSCEYDWLVGQECSNALVKLGITKKLIHVKVVKMSMSRPMLCNKRTFGKIECVGVLSHGL